MTRELVDLGVLAFFIVFVTLTFLGHPVGLIGATVCGFYLAAISIKEMQLSPVRWRWIVPRLVVALSLLAIRRIKNGHWF